jgi:hypothetical protein
LFWRVDPARDPRAITVLSRESVLTRIEFPLRELTTLVLALTELSVSAFVHVIADPIPDVST